MVLLECKMLMLHVPLIPSLIITELHIVVLIPRMYVSIHSFICLAKVWNPWLSYTDRREFPLAYKYTRHQTTKWELLSLKQKTFIFQKYSKVFEIKWYKFIYLFIYCSSDTICLVRYTQMKE